MYDWLHRSKISGYFDPHTSNPSNNLCTDSILCINFAMFVFFYSNEPPAEPENPFGEDWEESEKASEMKPVTVRALYDYVGQEDDELSFKAGTQLSLS